MNLSYHAQNRIETRLNSFTSCKEVLERVNRFNLPQYKTFVEVKRIDYAEIRDDSVKPDGIARGDSIIAVCESGYVKTVILRKSWSQSLEYKIIH